MGQAKGRVEKNVRAELMVKKDGSRKRTRREHTRGFSKKRTCQAKSTGRENHPFLSKGRKERDKQNGRVHKKDEVRKNPHFFEGTGQEKGRGVKKPVPFQCRKKDGSRKIKHKNEVPQGRV